LLALMQAAPPTQARPNLLLAALHERVLAGMDAPELRHPLADYFPSCGGARLPDAELPALLQDLVARDREVLLAHLQTRATQTNEIGRCAVLHPALQWLARRSGRHELALFDLGTSAGLNLGVERYGVDYGHFRLGRFAPGHPQIQAEWRGDQPCPPAWDWRLVQRLGVDPAPVDVWDEAQLHWLRACLWPHGRERAQRFEQAVALARAARPVESGAAAPERVERQADGLARLETWLDELPASVQPVLFNSWVLAYFTPEALAACQSRVAALVAERGLIWLCAESPDLHAAGLSSPPLPPQAQGLTLWSAHWRQPGTPGVQRQALAWSHPHGRWLQWLAGEDSVQEGLRRAP